MSSVYRIKQMSCVNSLKYFHTVDVLPPDIAHDILEGVAINNVCNIITGLVCVRTSYLALILLMAKLHPLSFHKLIKGINPNLLKLYFHPIFKIKDTACET